MNKIIGTALPLIGRVFTPMAMVVFLTYEIVQSQAVDGWWATAVLLGAACTAVGVEVVGILSGHALERFWRVGDTNRAIVSFVLLAVYTVAGIVILQGTVLVVIPVIAAVLYLTAALVEGVEWQMAQVAEETAVVAQFNLEQAKLDADHKRQLERDQALANAEATKEREREETERIRIQAETKAAVATARAAVKVAKRPTDTRQVTRQDTGILPADWRQLTDLQRYELAHATRDERDAIMPKLADRTHRLWHERLDKIASQNGNFLV